MSSVLIDTNLLILLVVGLFDRRLIGEHKRTKSFVPDDLDRLAAQLDRYEMLWITSHGLAEASNLLQQTRLEQGRALLQHLAEVSMRASESHFPKNELFQSTYVPLLGVADTGIILKSKRVSCVMTVDLDLYIAISRLGRTVVNFNHLRTQSLLA